MDSDGNIYEGEFSSDKRHGKGRLVKPKDDGIFEGEWLEGKFHGSGCFFWTAEKCYIGEFKDGKLEGIGKFYQDSIIYTGKPPFNKLTCL